MVNAESALRRAYESTRPSATPSARPPTDAQANSAAAEPQATELAPIAAMATFNVTNDVASLNKDSPSRTVTRMRGRPTRRANATAATASVHAPMAPSARTTATVKAVSSTSTTDSWKIGLISCRIATAEDSNAAAYSSGGNKTASTSSGLTSKAGTPGTKETPRPTTTSRIG